MSGHNNGSISIRVEWVAHLFNLDYIQIDKVQSSRRGMTWELLLYGSYPAYNPILTNGPFWWTWTIHQRWAPWHDPQIDSFPCFWTFSYWIVLNTWNFISVIIFFVFSDTCIAKRTLAHSYCKWTALFETDILIAIVPSISIAIYVLSLAKAMNNDDCNLLGCMSCVDKIWKGAWHLGWLWPCYKKGMLLNDFLGVYPHFFSPFIFVLGPYHFPLIEFKPHQLR